MKVTNTNYKTIQELKQNLVLSKVDTSKIFIQVFSGYCQKEELEQIFYCR